MKYKRISGITCLLFAAIIFAIAFIYKDLASVVIAIMALIVGSFLVNMEPKEFKDPFAALILVLLIIPFITLLIIISLKSNTSIWFDSLNLNQWINLYGSLLAYVGTICLGFVTIFQNKRITNITEKSVNGEMKDKKGFLLPKVYEIRDNKEIEKCYNVINSGICFYNAGNDYINNFEILNCQIESFKEPLVLKNFRINFIGLIGDSQRVYIPLTCSDLRIFKDANRIVLFTFSMKNSKGYSYQQNLKVMLKNCGNCEYKISGYDTSFSE